MSRPCGGGMSGICAKKCLIVLLFREASNETCRFYFVLDDLCRRDLAQQPTSGQKPDNEVQPAISALPLTASTVTDLHLRPLFTTTIRLPEPVTSDAPFCQEHI